MVGAPFNSKFQTTGPFMYKEIVDQDPTNIYKLFKKKLKNYLK